MASEKLTAMTAIDACTGDDLLYTVDGSDVQKARTISEVIGARFSHKILTADLLEEADTTPNVITEFTYTAPVTGDYVFEGTLLFVTTAVDKMEICMEVGAGDSADFIGGAVLGATTAAVTTTPVAGNGVNYVGSAVLNSGLTDNYSSGTPSVDLLSGVATNDLYNNKYLYIDGGTGAQQLGKITDYTSGGTATLEAAYGVAIDGTSTYEVLDVHCLRIFGRASLTATQTLRFYYGIADDTAANPAPVALLTGSSVKVYVL